ncbi:MULTISPECIES: hypothetical protein [Caldimonas]|jgi:hypothetical protein|uniref:hypothetical protein n=1 Tax=Caldimonas TaxID=196013 RepID=UPI000364F4C2|nr:MULTISPECIES: hypothetical protein [Caldimonas]GIX25344.1 MAG: hypothetical protein KatS3mg122_2575 [Caldimonas sp.]
MQAPAKYLLLIEQGGVMVARLFDGERRHVLDFDAGSEEVAVMTAGLQPHVGAQGKEWDAALAGHNERERSTAQVYVLDL